MTGGWSPMPGPICKPVTGNRKSGNAVTRYDSKSKVLGALCSHHTQPRDQFIFTPERTGPFHDPTHARPAFRTGRQW
jgi:hypothetical protein